jgi:hypothetical protein
MPLLGLDLPIASDPAPADVRSFLREAERRIQRFQRTSPIPGFVPCDFSRAYQILRAVADARLTPGRLFCEWGSGFGVVACLAAMLDFDAYGIEIEGELVEAAQQLADDFGLPVQFVQGSFIPAEADVHVTAEAAFAWLITDGRPAHEELGLDTDDMDVIFAYPWPDEEGLIGELFERHAARGALLVTYHEGQDYSLRRKIGPRRRSTRP